MVKISRTLHAKDKKKRKQRKFYKGKLIKKKRKKSGKFVPYISQRKKDGAIKLWLWEQRPMSKDSYRNFASNVRPYMMKTVYCPRLRIDVDPFQISNKERVEEFCLNHLWEGIWLVKGFSKGRNRYGIKNVTLCKVKITSHPEGLKAEMFENRRLFRYWFYKK